jgi:hypothetical protein
MTPTVVHHSLDVVPCRVWVCSPCSLLTASSGSPARLHSGSVGLVWAQGHDCARPVAIGADAVLTVGVRAQHDRGVWGDRVGHLDQTLAW